MNRSNNEVTLPIGIIVLVQWYNYSLIVITGSVIGHNKYNFKMGITPPTISFDSNFTLTFTLTI